jgi:plastocyanin
MGKLVLVLVASITATCAFSAVVDVHISNLDFMPQNVTINPGDSVRWINNEGYTHTATSGVNYTPDGKFDTGEIITNAKRIVVFNTSGVYYYFCNIQKDAMVHGNDYTVTVTGSASMTGSVTLDTFVGDPTGQSGMLEFRDPGTTNVSHSYPITLDAQSNYSIGTVEAGTWDVALKISHWLRSTVASVDVVNGSNGLDIELINGDSNMDNIVNLADINSIFVGYETTDPDADLDGSGQVDLPDLNITFINYGLTGSP